MRKRAYLMTYHRSPLALRRSRRLDVVTEWKAADFSLRKKTSGTQILSHAKSGSFMVLMFGSVNFKRGSFHDWRR